MVTNAANTSASYSATHHHVAHEAHDSCIQWGCSPVEALSTQSAEATKKMWCGHCEEEIKYVSTATRGWWTHIASGTQFCKDKAEQWHDCASYHYLDGCYCGDCDKVLNCA